MTRRILLAVWEVPALGGAATSAYALFRKLCRDGLDAHLVTLVDARDVPFLALTLGESYANPDGLPNVHTCVVDEVVFRPHDALARLVDTVAPEIALGYGDIATVLLKLAAPDLAVVFYAAGSQQAGFLLSLGRVRSGLALLDRAGDLDGAPAVVAGRESRAVSSADLIVACSELIRTLLAHFYPYPRTVTLFPEALSQAEWIHERAVALGGGGRPFAERPIDLLFVASSWSRAEKNLPVVRALAARMPTARIGIAGEGVTGVPGATCYGFLPQTEVLRLMGEARAVVCPSAFDGSPGILFEAVAMGCNVIASRNCGNWTICHADLLADPFTEDRFVEVAERAVRTKWDDRMEDFRARQSYATLRDILAVL